MKNRSLGVITIIIALISCDKDESDTCAAWEKYTYDDQGRISKIESNTAMKYIEGEYDEIGFNNTYEINYDEQGRVAEISINSNPKLFFEYNYVNWSNWSGNIITLSTPENRINKNVNFYKAPFPNFSFDGYGEPPPQAVHAAIGNDGIGSLFTWHDGLVRSMHSMHFRELSKDPPLELSYDNSGNLISIGRYKYSHDLNHSNPFYRFHDLLLGSPTGFFRIDIDSEQLMTYPSFLEHSNVVSPNNITRRLVKDSNGNILYDVNYELQYEGDKLKSKTWRSNGCQ